MTEWRAPFFFHEPRDTSKEREERLLGWAAEEWAD